MRNVIALIFAGLLTMGTAQAGIRFNVLGGITNGSPTVTPTSTTPYKSGNALTYGATIDIGVLPMFAIETGVLSVGKKFTQGAVTLNTRAYEVPVLLRLTALPILDIGAGIYIQSYKNTFDMEAGGIKVTGLKWTDMGLKNRDMGLKLSARLMLPIAPMLKFVVDGAYKMGMTDLDTSTAGTWKHKEIDALGGISLGF